MESLTFDSSKHNRMQKKKPGLRNLENLYKNIQCASWDNNNIIVPPVI
jgi:hypothetical protein